MTFLRRGLRKRPVRVLHLCSLVLLIYCESQLLQVSAFLQWRHWNQWSRVTSEINPVSWRRLLVVTSPTQELEEKLESLTVKDLREILRNSTLNHRGLLSRLKRKKQLVTFLKDNLGASSREILLPKSDVEAPFESAKGRLGSEHSIIRNVAMPGTNISPKEDTREKIYLQYPPLRDRNCSEVGEKDIRQEYHPIFAGGSLNQCDMDIVFVGTASCTPGVTRGASCTALRLNWNRHSIDRVHGTNNGSATPSYSGGTWLFDCGECTQLQIQRTVSVRPGKINKIFITHAHGDHSFGLPGLLCLMGQDRDRATSPPIDIYGPEGLRMWLRVAIRYSVSRIVPNYRVHELKDIPIAPEWERHRRANRYIYRGFNKKDNAMKRWGCQGLVGEDRDSWISQADMMGLQPTRQFGEIDGGRDIYPIYDHPSSRDGAPIWAIEDSEEVRVLAAPMSHSIPCVGYVVEEKSKPGRLRDDIVKPLVEKNLNALKAAGFEIPMKVLAVIKGLPVGTAFTFPDGTVITHDEAVEAPRAGRKVVVCGDTASSRAIEGLAMDADVVIHEATNSFLAGLDKGTDLRAVTRDAMVHGHSTPHMAGKFAKNVRAKKLVMNHFSARYKGDQAVDSLCIMTRLEEQAMAASGLRRDSVAAAWDFMVLPVQQSRGCEKAQ